MTDEEKIAVLLAKLAEALAHAKLLSARVDALEAEAARWDTDEYGERRDATPPPATATADPHTLDIECDAPPIISCYVWSALE